MTLPQHILNRLHLGKDIAAEVQAIQDNYRAWVYVQPLMETSFQKARERWTRERQYQPVDFSIKGYYIRYIELSDWHLEWGMILITLSSSGQQLICKCVSVMNQH